MTNIFLGLSVFLFGFAMSSTLIFQKKISEEKKLWPIPMILGGFAASAHGAALAF